MQIEVEMDCVRIEDQVVRRPQNIGRKAWLDYWEGVSDSASGLDEVALQDAYDRGYEAGLNSDTPD